MSGTTACIHPPNPTPSQPLDLLRLTRWALREIQAMMVRWGYQANDLERLSSTNRRVGKEKSSKKGMRSRAAGGPASNILFDENRLGWTETDLSRWDWCKVEKREREVESRRSRHQTAVTSILAICTPSSEPCKTQRPDFNKSVSNHVTQLRFLLRAFWSSANSSRLSRVATASHIPVRPYVFVHLSRACRTGQTYSTSQLRLDSGPGDVLPVSCAPTATEDPAIADVEPLLPLPEPLPSFPSPGPSFRQLRQAKSRLWLEAFEVLWIVAHTLPL